MTQSVQRRTIQRFAVLNLVLGLQMTALAAPPGNPDVGQPLPQDIPRISALGENPSLEDYLAYAALHNTGLRAAFNQWKASLERIPQVKALPDPRFNYSYFIEEVETRVGPQRQKFGLAQVFPWFGKLRLRGDGAGEAAEATKQAYESTKLKLFYRVKSAYYEYWYLARAIAVTKEHLRLVVNLEGVARTRFKAGTATHASMIQAQVELGKLDDRLRTLDMLRGPIVAKLNATLNRTAQQPLPWPHSLPDFPTSFSDTEALEWLAESNPDLARLDHLAEKEDISIKLAKRDYYPDFSLGVDYIDTDDALNPNVLDSGKDPIIAMVSVNLPIWYGRYRAAGREARFRKAAVEDTRGDLENRLQADLKLALYRYRDAERKIDLYGDTLVPKAEESLQVTQRSFESGQAGFIALIDAQRSLLEFQLSHARSQADREKGLAEVEMLSGREIKAHVSDLRE